MREAGALAPTSVGWSAGRDYCVHLVFCSFLALSGLCGCGCHRAPGTGGSAEVTGGLGPTQVAGRPCWRPLSRAQVPIDQFDPV